MAGPDLPEIPASLKSIQHYLKIASMHDQRDPVVSYWCRLYALQTGLKLSVKTPEETNFFLKLMDWLEATKKQSHDNDAIVNDVAAQAHLENWALKLFLYADKNDRASNFGKNVIQSFFTAGLLYDVLTIFGELGEEAMQNRKYAKWKATYIRNCQLTGETPVAGPLGEDTENIRAIDEPTDTYDGSPEQVCDDTVDTDNASIVAPNGESKATDLTKCVTDEENYTPLDTNEDDLSAIQTGREPKLSLEQTGKAQKYIKWAGSALNYDDVPTAVSNLRKALHLLTTGRELD